MSDGWETKRSREPGHTDWVIIRLGAPAKLLKLWLTQHILEVISSKVNVKGINVDEESKIEANSDAWEVVVDDSKTSADKEHAFKVKDNSKSIFAY